MFKALLEFERDENGTADVDKGLVVLLVSVIALAAFLA